MKPWAFGVVWGVEDGKIYSRCFKFVAMWVTLTPPVGIGLKGAIVKSGELIRCHLGPPDSASLIFDLPDGLRLLIFAVSFLLQVI